MDVPPLPSGDRSEPESCFEGALRKLFGSIEDEDSEETEDSDGEIRMITRVRSTLVEALCADAASLSSSSSSSSSSLEFIRWFVEKLESDIDEFIASAERCIQEKRKQQAAIQSNHREAKSILDVNSETAFPPLGNNVQSAKQTRGPKQELPQTKKPTRRITATPIRTSTKPMSEPFSDLQNKGMPATPQTSSVPPRFPSHPGGASHDQLAAWPRTNQSQPSSLADKRLERATVNDMASLTISSQRPIESGAPAAAATMAAVDYEDVESNVGKSIGQSSTRPVLPLEPKGEGQDHALVGSLHKQASSNSAKLSSSETVSYRLKNASSSKKKAASVGSLQSLGSQAQRHQSQGSPQNKSIANHLLGQVYGCLISLGLSASLKKEVERVIFFMSLTRDPTAMEQGKDGGDLPHKAHTTLVGKALIERKIASAGFSVLASIMDGVEFVSGFLIQSGRRFLRSLGEPLLEQLVESDSISTCQNSGSLLKLLKESLVALSSTTTHGLDNDLLATRLDEWKNESNFKYLGPSRQYLANKEKLKDLLARAVRDASCAQNDFSAQDEGPKMNGFGRGQAKVVEIMLSHSTSIVKEIRKPNWGWFAQYLVSRAVEAALVGDSAILQVLGGGRKSHSTPPETDGMGKAGRESFSMLGFSPQKLSKLNSRFKGTSRKSPKPTSVASPKVVAGEYADKGPSSDSSLTMSLVKIIGDSNKPIGLSLFLPESFRPFGIVVEALDSAVFISSMLAHLENLLGKILQEFTTTATRAPMVSGQGSLVCRGEGIVKSLTLASLTSLCTFRMLDDGCLLLRGLRLANDGAETCPNMSEEEWKYIASGDLCDPEDDSDTAVSPPMSIHFLLDRVTRALSVVTRQSLDEAFIVNLSFIVPIACEVARMGAIAAFGVGPQDLEDAFPAFELRKSVKKPILLLLHQLKSIQEMDIFQPSSSFFCNSLLCLSAYLERYFEKLGAPSPCAGQEYSKRRFQLSKGQELLEQDLLESNGVVGDSLYMRSFFPILDDVKKYFSGNRLVSKNVDGKQRRRKITPVLGVDTLVPLDESREGEVKLESSAASSSDDSSLESSLRFELESSFLSTRPALRRLLTDVSDSIIAESAEVWIQKHQHEEADQDMSRSASHSLMTVCQTVLTSLGRTRFSSVELEVASRILSTRLLTKTLRRIRFRSHDHTTPIYPPPSSSSSSSSIPPPSGSPAVDPELLTGIQRRLRSLDERVKAFQIHSLLDIEEQATAGDRPTALTPHELGICLERCATIARVIVDLREMRTAVGVDITTNFRKSTGVDSKYPTEVLRSSSDTIEKLIRLESTCLLGLQSLLTYTCDATTCKNGQQATSLSHSRTQPSSASSCARSTHLKGSDWICFQLFVQLMEQIRGSSEQAEPCSAISAFETALTSLWAPDNS